MEQVGNKDEHSSPETKRGELVAEIVFGKQATKSTSSKS